MKLFSAFLLATFTMEATASNGWMEQHDSGDDPEEAGCFDYYPDSLCRETPIGSEADFCLGSGPTNNNGDLLVLVEWDLVGPSNCAQAAPEDVEYNCRTYCQNLDFDDGYCEIDTSISCHSASQGAYCYCHDIF